MKIYHNPRCGKSRKALQAIEDTGTPCDVIEYLKTTPTIEELRTLQKLLGLKPLEFIRAKEDVFKEKYAGKSLTDEEWLQAIAENPILLERPIVVQGKKAWIVRTDEALSQIRKS